VRAADIGLGIEAARVLGARLQAAAEVAMQVDALEQRRRLGAVWAGASELPAQADAGDRSPRLEARRFVRGRQRDDHGIGPSRDHAAGTHLAGNPVSQHERVPDQR
jgi:hypothetical protein